MKKQSKFVIRILAWTIIIVISAAVLYTFNKKAFQNQTTAPQTVVDQLDFPLNKVTVNLKKKEFMDVLKNCVWIDVSNNIVAGSISLTPHEGSEKMFESIMNESGNAERLSALYKDEGFRWNREKQELTLPAKKASVMVPAWIVFQLIREGLFPELKTDED